MNKYILVILTALTLTLVSGKTFAGSWCGCYSCCDYCGNGYSWRSYDYGYSYYNTVPVFPGFFFDGY